MSNYIVFIIILVIAAALYISYHSGILNMKHIKLIKRYTENKRESDKYIINYTELLKEKDEEKDASIYLLKEIIDRYISNYGNEIYVGVLTAYNSLKAIEEDIRKSIQEINVLINKTDVSINELETLVNQCTDIINKLSSIDKTYLPNNDLSVINTSVEALTNFVNAFNSVIKETT